MTRTLKTKRNIGLALILVGVISISLTVGLGMASAPSLSVSNNTTGETLVGIQGGGVNMGKRGRVAMVNGSGETRWRAEDADSYFDVTMQENGTVLAAFMDEGYRQCGPFSPPCAHTGFRVIDPQPTPNVTFEYSFPIRTSVNSEVHDVERLPTGEYLMTDMEYERIMTVAPNGTKTWQWNASQFYDAPSDPTQEDWLHINDVDRIDSGRYLVSVRNADQLLVIERGRGVVEVVNRAGDPSLFHRQHNPQWLAPGAILIADSENNRVIEIHRNKSTGKWERVWTINGAGGVGFDWPRDADRLENGDTLITDSRNKRVVQVDESGQVVWSTSFQLTPYEADRLPDGETVGGPTYDRTGNTTSANVIPGLTWLTGGLHTHLKLPFWFDEWHLLVSMFALTSILGGGWLARPRDVRTRYGEELRGAYRAGRVLALPIGLGVLVVGFTPRAGAYTGLYLAVAVLLIAEGWREIWTIDAIADAIPNRVRVAGSTTLSIVGVVLAAGLVYRAPAGGLGPLYLGLAFLVALQSVQERTPDREQGP